MQMFGIRGYLFFWAWRQTYISFVCSLLRWRLLAAIDAVLSTHFFCKTYIIRSTQFGNSLLKVGNSLPNFFNPAFGNNDDEGCKKFISPCNNVLPCYETLQASVVAHCETHFGLNLMTVLATWSNISLKLITPYFSPVSDNILSFLSPRCFSSRNIYATILCDNILHTWSVT